MRGGYRVVVGWEMEMRWRSRWEKGRCGGVLWVGDLPGKEKFEAVVELELELGV